MSTCTFSYLNRRRPLLLSIVGAQTRADDRVFARVVPCVACHHTDEKEEYM